MTAEKQNIHPKSGTEMNGAETLVQVFADEGVDSIFGYSGGAVLPIFDALYRHNEVMIEEEAVPINLVVPANEQGAGFMAAGYARATGKVGVLVVTSGPGATNAITPIKDSMADSVPLVMISGQVPTGAMGTDAFQEAPVLNALGPCAKHVFLVKDANKLEETVRTAFEIARTGRPGPVVIDIPKDVQNWKGAYKGDGNLPIRGYRNRLEDAKKAVISDGKCAQFFNLLKNSNRPLIYAGGGVITSEASEELRLFAEKYNIPVVNTLNGIGAIPSDHKLALRMIGMHGTAFGNYAVEDCDMLIAIGARFDDRVAGNAASFAPKAKAIAHIDIDASEIGKIKTAHWGHVGEAKESLQRLLSYGKDFEKDYSRWIEHVIALKEKYPMNYDRKSKLIQPYYVLEELNKIVNGEAIISTGVGQHQIWASQYLDFIKPRRWMTSGAMATMGFGLPAAIGAQVACPEQMVIDIDGDGSIRMNMGELETVINYDLPVKVLLFNNSADGMVRQWQKMFFGKRYSGSDKIRHAKDFVKAAKADGFKYSKRVTKKEDVAETLQEFISYNGPAFLEVVIDRDANVYPMVAPGSTYQQMDTGDFIPSRPTPVEKDEFEEIIESDSLPDAF
ncbi:MAG: biosynthetic-type acetolactate synthase large subunit [Gammaproteobacteria bacterium]|nr:MAG: biosynthetic-type acetolactate synthase large subunit [Gammaproteobacteria bacterium]